MRNPLERIRNEFGSPSDDETKRAESDRCTPPAMGKLESLISSRLSYSFSPAASEWSRSSDRSVYVRGKIASPDGQCEDAILKCAPRDQELERRLERTRAAGLSNLRIISSGDEQYTLWLEQDQGCTLEDLIEKGCSETGSLKEIQQFAFGEEKCKYELFLQICNLLMRCYTFGLAHCDINPANICVRVECGQCKVSLIDFEFIQNMDKRLTAEIEWSGSRRGSRFGISLLHNTGAPRTLPYALCLDIANLAGILHSIQHETTGVAEGYESDYLNTAFFKRVGDGSEFEIPSMKLISGSFEISFKCFVEQLIYAAQRAFGVAEQPDTASSLEDKLKAAAEHIDSTRMEFISESLSSSLNTMGYPPGRPSHLVARDSAVREIERRLEEPANHRFLGIEAGPASGKTTLLAHCFKSSYRMTAIHCIRFDQPDSCENTLASLCLQLAKKSPAFAEHLYRHFQDDPKAAHDIGQSLAIALTRTGKPEDGSVLLILDSIDELTNPHSEENEIAAFLLRYAAKLPEWVRVVYSIRKESAGLRFLKRQSALVDISNDEYAKQDLIDYANGLLSESADKVPACLAADIAKRSGGMFLYVKYICKDIAEFGMDGFGSPEFKLPEGLGEYYRSFFSTRLTGYDDDIMRPFHALTVSDEPVPTRVLLAGLGDEWNPSKFGRFQNIFGRFLDYRRENDCLSIFHKSLHDWLTTNSCPTFQMDEIDGYRILASGCMARYLIARRAAKGNAAQYNYAFLDDEKAMGGYELAHLTTYAKRQESLFSEIKGDVALANALITQAGGSSKLQGRIFPEFTLNARSRVCAESVLDLLEHLASEESISVDRVRNPESGALDSYSQRERRRGRWIPFRPVYKWWGVPYCTAYEILCEEADDLGSSLDGSALDELESICSDGIRSLENMRERISDNWKAWAHEHVDTALAHLHCQRGYALYRKGTAWAMSDSDFLLSAELYSSQPALRTGVYLRYAESLIFRNRLDDALKIFENEIPSATSSYYPLLADRGIITVRHAELLLSSGQYSKAFEVLKSMQANDPIAAYIRSTGLDKGESDKEEEFSFIQSAPRNQVGQLYFCLARAYHGQGNYEAALRYSEQSLAAVEEYYGSPEAAETCSAHNQAGWALLEMGSADDALNHFEKAMTIRIEKYGRENMLTTVSMRNKAKALQRRGRNADIEEAKDLLCDVIEIRKDLLYEEENKTRIWEAVLDLAELCLSMGDYQDALRVIRGKCLSKNIAGMESSVSRFVFAGKEQLIRARCHLELGEPQEGRDEARAAFDNFTQAYGKSRPNNRYLKEAVQLLARAESACQVMQNAADR